MKNRYFIFFSKSTELRIFILFMAFVICSPLMFSQTDASTMIAEKGNFDKIVEIKMNKRVQFGDSLIVVLEGFSHKETNGKGSKGMSHLKVSKGKLSEEIILSEYGSSSNPGKYSYDTQIWNGYSFELKKLNYNSSIEVIISKAIEE